MRKESTLTPKEFKKKYIKSQTLWFRWMFWLKISSIKVGKYHAVSGYRYTSRGLNPLNPLSYLVLIIGLLVVLIQSIIQEYIPEVIRAFKYR
ncbi:hypothetical protein [Leeuwenhoekiella sp. MAR_2009_132]|uniref:hypothetical protein n=1 Tax=Leeuwenhoekiella sp. MAR_2009_132 TaxID=1392489 RepID=UPI000F67EF13|nr:hypothetical protein [Leeuwenhoekiella sp. MAR_2009_132]